MKKIFKLLIVFFALAWIFNFVSSKTTNRGDYCNVIRVVDGDTFIAEVSGKEKRIRMIGIDTPESVHPDSSKNTEEGKLASEFTKNLLQGKKVKLEYDIEVIDKYDRTLAYVYLEDGTFVNDYIIRSGYAYPLTIVPNVKHALKFKNSFEYARENNFGLWNDEKNK